VRQSAHPIPRDLNPEESEEQNDRWVFARIQKAPLNGKYMGAPKEKTVTAAKRNGGRRTDEEPGRAHEKGGQKLSFLWKTECRRKSPVIPLKKVVRCVLTLRDAMTGEVTPRLVTAEKQVQKKGIRRKGKNQEKMV